MKPSEVINGETMKVSAIVANHIEKHPEDIKHILEALTYGIQTRIQNEIDYGLDMECVANMSMAFLCEKNRKKRPTLDYCIGLAKRKLIKHKKNLRCVWDWFLTDWGKNETK